MKPQKSMQITGLILAALFSGSASATTMIDTTLSWNGSSFVSLFGESNTATYGQTFVAPTDNVLDSFTFYLNDGSHETSIPNRFRAYVGQWDGLKTSSILFESSINLATTNNGGAGGFEPITVNTGGVSLTTGNNYVAFFSASKLFDGITDLSDWGLTNANIYSNGGFVYINNGSDFSQLTTNTWHNFGDIDLAFKMNFSSGASVPEPGSLALLGLGMTGLAFVRRRKAAR